MYPITDHYDGNKFHNLSDVEVSEPGLARKILLEYLRRQPGRTPRHRPGPFPVNKNLLNQPPSDGVQVTWLGHSTVLLQVEGITLLTDPVWYSRASPFTLAGPKRFFAPPLALNELPRIDAVLLSHDHYDHLDRSTVLELLKRDIPVITLLGVGKRLLDWGARPAQITELDWWQQTEVQHLTITAAPAQHFSGRGLKDRCSTLWGSFAIRGRRHAIYFGADSGYHSGFAQIGKRLGPFDLTMLDSGAYFRLWPAVHMGPENAIKAHRELGGKLFMPIHWGTFALAFHPWKEPVERVIKAAENTGVLLLLPAPGSTCSLAAGPHNSEWWQALT